MSRDPAPQSAFEEVPNVRVIGCRHQGDYVQFVLREWNGGGSISITGSYDAMFAGFSFGKTFAEFLARCDMDYMMKKLLNYKHEEIDWEESCKALKRELLRNRREEGLWADAEYERLVSDRFHVSRYRKERLLTKELAREQYDKFFSDGWEGDEEKWRRIIEDGNPAAFGEEAYEHQCKRIRGWVPYFWRNFWQPFMEYLKANPTAVLAAEPKASSDV